MTLKDVNVTCYSSCEWGLVSYLQLWPAHSDRWSRMSSSASGWWWWWSRKTGPVFDGGLGVRGFPPSQTQWLYQGASAVWTEGCIVLHCGCCHLWLMITLHSRLKSNTWLIWVGAKQPLRLNMFMIIPISCYNVSPVVSGYEVMICAALTKGNTAQQQWI